MAQGNQKFLKRQKELQRQAKQAQKRQEKEDRKTRKGGPDDDIAAIQAAMDAGLNPGTAEDRIGEVGAVEDDAGPQEEEG